MSRLCIVLPQIRASELSLTYEIAALGEGTENPDIVYVLPYTDKTYTDTLRDKTSKLGNILEIQIDDGGSDTFYNICIELNRRHLASFYYFAHEQTPFNVNAIYNHCQGQRELQLFGSRLPFFWQKRPTLDGSGPISSHQDGLRQPLYAYFLGTLTNCAVSNTLLARLSNRGRFDDYSVDQILLSSAESIIGNSAYAYSSPESLNKVSVLKRHLTHIRQNSPESADKLLTASLTPKGLRELLESMSWRIGTMSLISHFGSDCEQLLVKVERTAPIPGQRMILETIASGDSERLLQLVDRAFKGNIARGLDRETDFTPHKKPLVMRWEDKIQKTPSSDLDCTTQNGNHSPAAIFPGLQRRSPQVAGGLLKPRTQLRRILRSIDRRLGPDPAAHSHLAAATTAQRELETFVLRKSLTYPGHHERPRYNFSLIGQGGFGTHRDGWGFVMQSLLETIGHDDTAIGFDGFVEKSFCWGFGAQAPARATPWFGISHRPPGIPSFYGWKERIEFFHSPFFQITSTTLAGLIALSTQHAEYLQRMLGVPVHRVLHPTNLEVPKWRAEELDARPNLVQIGSWLRKLHSIFLLPEGNYSKKILFKSEKDLWENSRFVSERDWLAEQGINPQAHYHTAGVIPFLEAKEYDRLLCSSIVFLDMYDATANNTVLECIARHTPIVVKRIPATIEYLGEDYQLFFDELDDVPELVADRSRLYQASEYLRERAALDDFKVDYFAERISSIGRLLTENAAE